MSVPKGTRIGGRKKGTPNKVTADIRAAAQKHGPAMIEALARIATKGESEAARVSAINALLDRGYGKAAQPLTGEGGEGPVKMSLKVRFVRP